MSLIELSWTAKDAKKDLKQLDISQMIDTGISLRMFSFEEKEKHQRLAIGDRNVSMASVLHFCF